MPISYQIDSVSGVVNVSFRGRVTIDEFRAQRAALTSDPLFRSSMHRLTDVRDLTELPRMEDLREFAAVSAEARRKEPAGVRRGVIVGSPSAYGAIRQYQTFLWLAGYSVDILASDAEAKAWLAGLGSQVQESEKSGGRG
jgi:hypothetical protein